MRRHLLTVTLSMVAAISLVLWDGQVVKAESSTNQNTPGLYNPDRHPGAQLQDKPKLEEGQVPSDRPNPSTDGNESNSDDSPDDKEEEDRGKYEESFGNSNEEGSSALLPEPPKNFDESDLGDDGEPDIVEPDEVPSQGDGHQDQADNGQAKEIRQKSKYDQARKKTKSSKEPKHASMNFKLTSKAGPGQAILLKPWTLLRDFVFHPQQFLGIEDKGHLAWAAFIYDLAGLEREYATSLPGPADLGFYLWFILSTP